MNYNEIEIDKGVIMMKWLSDVELMELKERGFEVSNSYDTEEEALEYVKYLKDLSKDPSYIVSIAGLYAHLDHYPQVVFKYRMAN
jgi:hypothetical protein